MLAGLGIVLVLIGFGLMAFENLFLGILLVILGIVVATVVILNQWQRGVVLTLGKYSGTLGPGLNFVIPFVQQVITVDVRIVTTEVPKQEIMTKDNVPVLINAVVYFKVEKPEDAITKIENYNFAVAQFTQAAVRDVIGNNELDAVLMQRDKLADAIKQIVDKDTGEWGVDIQSINIQEIELPTDMKRAMAKQAESERERRARVTLSAGELEASKNLAAAAERLSTSGALHLRTLQTISEIAADPSEKIIIIVPTDFASTAAQLVGGKKKD
ncbi:TPA: slipin family protein [Candidatus Micrarchaeota archaeon]|nr:slipin family protein [Candidatus Micrarchaeota archaeon]